MKHVHLSPMRLEIPRRWRWKGCRTVLGLPTASRVVTEGPPSLSQRPETTTVSTDWVRSVEPTMLPTLQSQPRRGNRRSR